MPPRTPPPKGPVDLDPILLELWDSVARGGLASEALAEAFRAAGPTSPAFKGRVTQELYALIRNARRVEFALEGSGAPHAGPLRERAWLLASRVVTGKLTPEAAAAEFPRVDWEAVAAVDERIAEEADPARRFGLAYGFPDPLAEAFLDAFGDDAEALAESLALPAPRTLRVNTLMATREAAAAELEAAGLKVRAGEYSSTALILDGPGDPFATAAYREGRVEFQDEASQLVAELVAPASGTLVIDACAGAGGKTLALGAWMRNKGMLVAVDRHNGRLTEFKRRARRAGLFCHRAIKADLLAQPWPKELTELEGKAARVLVDAPCTGTGAIRRNPELRLGFDDEALTRLPPEQEGIARAAMAWVKPNGRLIYATCSMLPDENERVVERLLRDARFSLVPIAEILGGARARKLADPQGQFLKVQPHRHGADGFFAAVLRRKDR
ncbi:MAG: RsmB/NOP family class I SAM-dependent RNA methyltransferase [Planctomycetes bacterium]|nr:RsmB/NOP family class I SAM-dependent RNA methyltransferase [Planctomycetota bacterium]